MPLLTNCRLPRSSCAGSVTEFPIRRSSSIGLAIRTRRIDWRASMKRLRPPPPSIAPSVCDQAAPLSPFLIRKLAGRKGLTVDSVMKGKGGMRFVSLADSKSGALVGNPGKYRGFTLAEAKRFLEQLPDRSRPST